MSSCTASAQPPYLTYDPHWPQLFERLRAVVDAALDGIPHETVHVGSTAVPGLAARPIIDLDAVVPARQVTAAVAALAAAGWQPEGDLASPTGKRSIPFPVSPITTCTS
jgi:GrpB-like predicted nucleotidyltransferase (UPF0157 family)